MPKNQYLSCLKLPERNSLPDLEVVIVADNVKVSAEINDYPDYVCNSGNFVSRFHEFGEDAVEVSRIL